MTLVASPRWRVAIALVLLVGGLAAGALLVSRDGPGDAGAALPRPVLPAAPEPTPFRTVVTDPGGARHTQVCPFGVEPEIQLGRADFTPQLVDAMTFRAGRYRIGMSGVVANDTNAAIVVTAVHATVQGAPWPAAVSVPRIVAAHDSVPLVIEGTYDSAKPQRAVVQTHLSWKWQDPAFQPCGREGLIEDD